jgi:hypothetical protein
VIAAVDAGDISRDRYDSYGLLRAELEDIERKWVVAKRR